MSRYRRPNIQGGIFFSRLRDHAIRNDADSERHVDYVRSNPVKRRYATRVRDWPYSSFYRYVKNDFLTANWGGNLLEIEGRFGE